MKKYKIIRSTQGFLLGKVFMCDEISAKSISKFLNIPLRVDSIEKIEEGLYKYQTVHYTLIIQEVN